MSNAQLIYNTQLISTRSVSTSIGITFPPVNIIYDINTGIVYGIVEQSGGRNLNYFVTKKEDHKSHKLAWIAKMFGVTVQIATAGILDQPFDFLLEQAFDRLEYELTPGAAKFEYYNVETGKVFFEDLLIVVD